MIPFQVQIPDDKVDKHLELHLRSELPGILHWAIEGCRMWQKEGLEKPPVMQDALKEYRGEIIQPHPFIRLNACHKTCAFQPGNITARAVPGIVVSYPYDIMRVYRPHGLPALENLSGGDF